MTSPAQALPSLGLRALELARAELARGVREEPSHSNTGPDVARYLAGCVRGGKRLGLTSAKWCAAFVSWCVWQAWATDKDICPQDEAEVLSHAIATWGDGCPCCPPIGYRAAVAELVQDARATGTWRDITAAERPQQGDLLVFASDDGDPRIGGPGHVEFIDEATADGWWCIGGYVHDAVSRELRRTDDRELRPVGWISLG